MKPMFREFKKNIILELQIEHDKNVLKGEEGGLN